MVNKLHHKGEKNKKWCNVKTKLLKLNSCHMKIFIVKGAVYQKCCLPKALIAKDLQNGYGNISKIVTILRVEPMRGCHDGFYC